MDAKGLVVALAIILFITTGFAVTRVVLDVKRYLAIASKPSLVSLISFVLGWMCWVSSMGTTLWTIKKTLDIQNNGIKAGDKFVPSVGVGQSDVQKAMVRDYITPSIVIVTGLWFIKGSFFAMNFNLKPYLSPALKWTLCSLGVFLVLTYLGNVLVFGFWCRPISTEWSLDATYCNPLVDARATAIYTALNVASDIYTMAVPIIILRKLKLRRRDQWAIGFLCFLGLCTATSTIVRSALLIRLGQLIFVDPYGTLSPSTTTLLYVCHLFAYSELCVALIAASLPSLRSQFHLRRRNSGREKSSRRRSRLKVGGSGMDSKHGMRDADAISEELADEDDGRKLVIQKTQTYAVEYELGELEQGSSTIQHAF